MDMEMYFFQPPSMNIMTCEKSFEFLCFDDDDAFMNFTIP